MIPEAVAVAEDGTVFAIGTRSRMDSPVTAAFDSSGALLWSNDQSLSNGPESLDYRIEAFAARDGSYYVACDFYEVVTLFDRFGNIIKLYAPVETISSEYTAYLGYFIAKYSSKGKLVWAQNTYEGDFNNYASARATAVTTFNEIDLLIGGLRLEGTVTFGQGTEKETDVTAPSQFAAQYSADGNLKWLQEFGGSVSFLAAVQTAQNAVVMAGVFKDSLTLPDGTTLIDEQGDGAFFLVSLCN